MYRKILELLQLRSVVPAMDGFYSLERKFLKISIKSLRIMLNFKCKTTIWVLRWIGFAGAFAQISEIRQWNHFISLNSKTRSIHLLPKTKKIIMHLGRSGANQPQSVQLCKIFRRKQTWTDTKIVFIFSIKRYLITSNEWWKIRFYRY